MPSQKNTLAGLDAVRVLALILVVYQHTCTLLDLEEATIVFGLSLGQLGVALFLAVSGLLAGDTRRPPLNWLLQRLYRVYPAFWIVLAFSFFLAGVSGVKSFDLLQVLAQFSGFGLFSHLSNLVNSPTWFVSLLLVCYLGTFAARVIGYPFLIGLCIVTALLVLVGTVPRPWLVSHLLTYAMANTIAFAPRTTYRRYMILGFGLLTMILCAVQPRFGYTFSAILLVEAALYIKRVPRPITLIAQYSYEFYLIHGLFLNGFIRYLPGSPALAVVLAIVVSAVGSVLLHHLVEAIMAPRTGNSQSGKEVATKH